MLCRDLVHLAALVSLRARDLIESPQPLASAGIEQYWAASKCRLDRWGRELKALSRPAERGYADRFDARFTATLAEILTGEMLTRVWTAICKAHDRRIGRGEAEPVARSVLIGHLDARRRVLTLLVHDHSLADHVVTELNELRRLTERWTDLLVAHIACFDDVCEAAFHPEQCRRLVAALGPIRGGYDRQRWSLLVGSLPIDFASRVRAPTANGDLNAAIAAGIISCFGASLFDGVGNMLGLAAQSCRRDAIDQRADFEHFLNGSKVANRGGELRPNSFSRARFPR